MRRPCACCKPVVMRPSAAACLVWALCLSVLCLSITAGAQDPPPAAQDSLSTACAPAAAPGLPAWEPVGPPVPPELGVPAPVAAAVVQAPPPPAPRHPRRVLLIGDSLMQNGCLGSQLEARFKRYQGVAVARWAKQSTGLARKDFFDWSAKLKELIAKHRPDLIIAVWGANDCQSVTNTHGKALAVFGTEAWDSAYGARVEEITAIAHEAGAELVLIGLPCMRNEKYGARIARLNSVVEQHASKAGGIYLPTWGITSTSKGTYLASVKYNGKSVTMRQKDGIHLSNGGAGYVSDWLCAEMEKRFELQRQ